MITQLLIVFFVTMAGKLAALLPTYTPPTGLSLAVLAAADWILPIGAIASMFAVVVAFVAASLLWIAINWVIRKIPTIS